MIIELVKITIGERDDGVYDGGGRSGGRVNREVKW